MESALSELEKQEIRELRSALESLQEELQALLAVSAEGSRPVAVDAPIGRISRMDAMQQQSMAVANRLAAEQRLQRVQAALQRIAADEYGDCIRCEESVGLKRLQAQPEAVLCIECQSQRETG
ncbi:MAG: TraR/DksA family transcriptional regulator [bacterium]|nr:TraR/DksA family transcriptional regulator [bacterium]